MEQNELRPKQKSIQAQTPQMKVKKMMEHLSEISKDQSETKGITESPSKTLNKGKAKYVMGDNKISKKAKGKERANSPNVELLDSFDKSKNFSDSTHTVSYKNETGIEKSKTVSTINVSINNPPNDKGNHLEDRNLKWKPPAAFQPFIYQNDQTVFDHEELQDDKKELWLFRVPLGLENMKLEGSIITLPPLSHSKIARIGTIEGQHKDKFGLHCLPKKENFLKSIDDDHLEEEKVHDDVDFIGCQDMYDVSCLMPSRQRDGHLVLETKQFSQRIAITQLIDLPDPKQAALDILAKPKTPLEQPKDLKLQFRPYGFDTGMLCHLQNSKKRKQEATEYDVNEDFKSNMTTGNSITLEDEKASLAINLLDALPRIVKPQPSRKKIPIPIPTERGEHITHLPDKRIDKKIEDKRKSGAKNKVKKRKFNRSRGFQDSF
ncbi:hypothetical protein G9A89_020819 [Geosiphon pyriformis]|nr:hypothetical protein G9A89_020819 [Geosiphon pyriformis]